MAMNTCTIPTQKSRSEIIASIAGKANAFSALLSAVYILPTSDQNNALATCSSIANDVARDLHTFVGGAANEILEIEPLKIELRGERADRFRRTLYELCDAKLALGDAASRFPVGAELNPGVIVEAFVGLMDKQISLLLSTVENEDDIDFPLSEGGVA
jgi:hypothetical protein